MSPPGGVSVIAIDLEADFDAGLLDEVEQQRAARYRFERGRRRWAAARCGLRRVLGRAAGRDPRELHFRTAEHGKPRLDFEGAPHFNLSHSDAVAIVAVCPERDVGADIEVHNDRTEVERLAARFFSSEESATLARLEPAERRVCFFDLWSAKEAVLKCDGRGLGGVLLSSFSVTPRVAAPVSARWWVSPVEVAPGYSAALALDGVEPAAVEFAWESGS